MWYVGIKGCGRKSKKLHTALMHFREFAMMGWVVKRKIDPQLTGVRKLFFGIFEALFWAHYLVCLSH
jgi:uncharacterized protein YhhL (DUF1145 family)